MTAHRPMRVLTEAAYRTSSLARQIVSRGPWEWAGKKPILFFRSGRLFTPWGSGSWGLAGE